MVGVILFVFMMSGKKPQQTTQALSKSESGYKYARSSHRINKFSYTGYADTKKILSIQCRYLSIHRKKIGGLRFNLIKEAVLEDGLVQLYRYTKPAEGQADTASLPGNSDLAHALKEITSKDSKLLSNFKNVASIMIQPVKIEIFTNNTSTTKITAGSAFFNLTEQNIVFSKDVTVICAGRTLRLDRLEFNPENEQLAGSDYVLNTPDGESSGKHITTDLNLVKVGQ
ncbi:MAG: hypothetical protein ABIJ31_12860 [Pseudomonadota bacterium]